MKNMTVEQVEALLAAVKQGDAELAATCFAALAEQNELNVLAQVEVLSKNLHDTLAGFGEDTQLLQQTKHDLPDVAERLTYVMEATEAASNKTLAASENVLAILESIPQENTPEVAKAISEIQAEITEIMMAQSFQDLTGQVLNRVLILMGSFEQSLHELIAKAGIDIQKIPEKSESSDDLKKQEMQGIGPNVTQKGKVDAAESQADVDDLLSDLGI